MKRCVTLAFTLLFSLPVIADTQANIIGIKHQWAIATYQTPENKQGAAFNSLLKNAPPLVNKGGREEAPIKLAETKDDL